VAEGLTSEDLDKYRLDAGLQVTGSSPEHVRTRAILRDIYNRHGISGEVPLNQAVALIADRANKAGIADEGGDPSTAWANPEEKRLAQIAYAERGRTPAEKQKRLDESVYLMDPGRQEYWQSYGRDMDFVGATYEAATRELPENFRRRGTEGAVRRLAFERALNQWDRSNHSGGLYRKGIVQDTYAGTGGLVGGIENATDNAAFNRLELLPDTSRYGTSASSRGVSDAGSGAFNTLHARENYRASSPAPVLPDLPSSATPQQRAERLRELNDLIRRSEPDPAGVRVQQLTGITPSPFVADAVTAVESIADGTQAIPGMFFARPALKAAKLRGAGWLPRVGKTAAGSLASDAGQDMALSGGIMAGASAGANPDRTWPEYLFKAADLPPPKNKADSQEARDQLTRMRLQEQDRGVSAAEAAAYKKLQSQIKPWAPLP